MIFWYQIVSEKYLIKINLCDLCMKHFNKHRCRSSGLLVQNTYQCSRRVCRKAERPSIRSRMTTVIQIHGVNTRNVEIPEALEAPKIVNPFRKTIVHKTSESSADKKYNNHKVNQLVYLLYLLTTQTNHQTATFQLVT